MKETLLILHFIGLAMGLGTSFAFMFLGIAASKMDKEESIKFTLKASAISRMGHIGLALLVISGLLLVGDRWDILLDNPLFIAKLALVVLLGALIGIATAAVRRAKSGNAEQQIAKASKVGPVSLLVGLTIVVLAVLIFN